MKKILVTGGAGYIGSHIVKNLAKDGYSVLVIDNLSSGYLEPIEILKEAYKSIDFFESDLSDSMAIKQILEANRPDAAIHLAAKIDARESVLKPEYYRKQNYENSLSLVKSMISSGIDKLIFSSTCAVYGESKYLPIDENHPTFPTNPYGQTKLDFENFLKKEKLKSIIFRFFNVGGSDPEGMIGKSNISGDGLFENIIKVGLGQKETLEIYGDDFDTPDGTAVRDYIHVEDIAQAHILGLKKIDELNGEIFNLGSEKGFSVKEVIGESEKVLNQRLPYKTVPKKKGDQAISLASAKKAKDLLKWQPKYQNLSNLIDTDWQWRVKHPGGYSLRRKNGQSKI